jgi:hypothetical protein
VVELVYLVSAVAVQVHTEGHILAVRAAAQQALDKTRLAWMEKPTQAVAVLVLIG